MTNVAANNSQKEAIHSRQQFLVNLDQKTVPGPRGNPKEGSEGSARDNAPLTPEGLWH